MWPSLYIGYDLFIYYISKVNFLAFLISYDAKVNYVYFLSIASVKNNLILDLLAKKKLIKFGDCLFISILRLFFRVFLAGNYRIVVSVCWNFSYFDRDIHLPQHLLMLWVTRYSRSDHTIFFVTRFCFFFLG